jgi:two-component system response regulator LytT
MKILIIEDEWSAAEALVDMIQVVRPTYEIVKIIESVAESIEYLTNPPPLDLIMSDIHLSDGISFELFNSIQINIPVLFTTAFDNYAIQAFKLNSIDYLLKPIHKQELEQALDKFDRNTQKTNGLELAALQHWMQAQQSNKPPYKQRFLIKTGQHMVSIYSDDIAFFTAENGLVFLTTFQQHRHLIDYTLDQLENQLDPTLFFRISRQCMLHIRSIVHVAPYFKGKLSLEIKPEPEEKQTVSQSRAAAFKKWLDL